ncbi:hypothetical protein [Pseudonocardia sp. TRM90224]|uniref:hypothetical protein n=1 Tax=Pseudonocardia sp. TRM90224 TaxID=2812678 RepID=UPI001E292A4C|nr:hypothetical protein [Pseudonocardia sp. TRM90224]
MSIADNAAKALESHRRHSNDVFGTDLYRRRVQAAIGRDVTAMLGVHPADVVVTTDPRRAYAGYAWHHIVVCNPDSPARTLRFIPDPVDLSLFHLLGECSACAGEVPVALIATLADLGRYLEQVAGDHVPPHPEFFGDAGHSLRCRFKVHPAPVASV